MPPSSLSVIVPAYNGEAFLAEALESVFHQTRLPDEILVVDDHSTDATPQIASSLARHAPVPLRLIRLPQNSGSPARPVNVGLAEARGELIAVLDQDDLLLPNKLRAQAAVLEEQPRTVLVGSYRGSLVAPDEADPFQVRAFEALGAGSSGAVLPGDEVLRLLIRRGNFFVGYPGFLFRKGLALRKGGVEESLKVGSDYDLVCWLCLQGRVALLPAVHYVRREHPDNICNNRLAMYLDLTRVRAHYLRRHRWLLDDVEASRELRTWFVGFAAATRLAQHYRLALECTLACGEIWGWDRGLVGDVLKLPLQWLKTRALRREPVLTEWTHPGTSSRAA
jgi:glycosyltransferase involved in cell wall biosynthesis